MGQMKSFISDYLRANERKELVKVLSFYGDNINYYAKGNVSKNYIKTDKELFFNSWHKLTYTLEDDLQISNSGDSDTITLTFTFSFLIDTSKKHIQGTAKNTWGIEKAKSNPKIITEKQTVIKRTESRL